VSKGVLSGGDLSVVTIRQQARGLHDVLAKLLAAMLSPRPCRASQATRG
jgi:hypothetical protein